MTELFRVSQESLLPRLTAPYSADVPLGTEVIQAYWENPELRTLEDAVQQCLIVATPFQLMRFVAYTLTFGTEAEDAPKLSSDDEIDTDTKELLMEFTESDVAVHATSQIAWIRVGTMAKLRSVTTESLEQYIEQLMEEIETLCDEQNFDVVNLSTIYQDEVVRRTFLQEQRQAEAKDPKLFE